MRAMIVMIAVVLTAVFASSALGAGNSSAKAAYGKKGSSVQAVLSAKTTKAAPKKVVVKHVAAKTATLPFTGMDLGFVAGAGVVLLGMGFSLRRVTRKQPSA